MRWWKDFICFYIGGMLYVLLELLWRGWSHGSMFLLGGTCFVLIGYMDRVKKPLSFTAQMFFGAAVITAMELLTGLIVNCYLGWNIWDYSGQPGQFLGQICIVYILLWIPVSAIAILAETYLRHWLFHEPVPQYRWI